MFTKIHIKKHERGLWFRDGDFLRLLLPGDHRTWSRMLNVLSFSGHRDRIQVVDASAVKFEHPMLEQLLKEPTLRESLLVVENSDTQRALVWKDGRIFAIVGPGQHAFWKGIADLKVEQYDIDSFRFTH